MKKALIKISRVEKPNNAMSTFSFRLSADDRQLFNELGGIHWLRDTLETIRAYNAKAGADGFRKIAPAKKGGRK